jgi:hypothetical protein
MAIVFEQERKPVNWFAIFSILFIVIFVIVGAYFLFFTESPRIDLVLPPALEQADQISDLEFIDPQPILTSSAYKSLRVYVGPPAIGSLGRANPFLQF